MMGESQQELSKLRSAEGGTPAHYPLGTTFASSPRLA